MRHNLIFSIILGLFLSFRLLNIHSSLEFFNDIGRDFLVMIDWRDTGRPPLLGPQTSVLPFNQSAWYFYLLYPFYLIFGGSLLSTIYACAFFYIASSSAIYFYLNRKKSSLLVPFLIFAFLLTIHPQVIIQTRFVWNPSFLPPMLAIATFSFLLLTKRWSNKIVWLIGLTLALAVSLNYSAAPAVLGFFITAIIFWKKRGLLLWGTTLLGLMWWNLPTLFFELRHKFLLTNMMLVRPALPQHRVELSSKLMDLIRYVVAPSQISTQLFILISLLAVVILFVNKKKRLTVTPELRVGLTLFTITTLATILAPFDIQSHYVFPVLTLGAVVIALLPLRISLIITSILSVMWLTPKNINGYFQPAIRNIAQLEECAQLICKQEKNPFFVSLQAGFYGFHAGPEYRYLFKRHGCQVRIIETQPSAAQEMALVIDNSSYEHGKTAFNELTLFGESEVKTIHQCPGNIRVYMLSK